MNCPKCNGPMWDNRQKKKNPKAPDFKCKDQSCDGVIWPPKNQSEFDKAKKAMQDPEPAPQSSHSESGVDETRKHLMQSANLMLLTIKATMYVGEQAPEALRTEERYGAILGQLFKEASNKRTNDGVNWWSYIDRMPTSPIK